MHFSEVVDANPTKAVDEQQGLKLKENSSASVRAGTFSFLSCVIFSVCPGAPLLSISLHVRAHLTVSCSFYSHPPPLASFSVLLKII